MMNYCCLFCANNLSLSNENAIKIEELQIYPEPLGVHRNIPEPKRNMWKINMSFHFHLFIKIKDFKGIK